MENAGSGYGLTPGSYDFADSPEDRDERSRSAALRARIAILAAGPDPDPVPLPPPVDVAAAVDETVRALLPGLVRDAVREAVRDSVRESVEQAVGPLLAGSVNQAVQAAVTASLPDLLGPAVAEVLEQQRAAVVDVIERQVTELRAAVVANATMPSPRESAPRPDPLLVEMASLRSDVTRAIDSVHQQVAGYVAERFSAVRAELRADINAEVTSGHVIVVDRIRRGLIAPVNEALISIQSEFAATAQAHRISVNTLSDEVRSLVAEQVEALRHASGEIDFLGDNLRSTLTAYADEQLAVLEASADRSGAGIADLSQAVQAQVAELSVRVAHELQSVVVAGRESLGSIGPSVRGDVNAVARAVQTDVEALTGGVREDLDGLATRVRRDIESLATAVRTDVDVVTARTKSEIERLVSDVRSTLARELETAIAAAREGVVVGTGAAVDRGVGELRSAVAATEQELAASRSEMALFSDRFVKAGHALLDHLAARDLLVEQARDEQLAQLLRELTVGMSERERSAATERLTKITQRRRDARDAERWRAARPPVPILPADIASEDELIALIEAPFRAQAKKPASVVEEPVPAEPPADASLSAPERVDADLPDADAGPAGGPSPAGYRPPQPPAR